jgi:hypothetical protein
LHTLFTFPQYDVRFIAVGDGVDSENGVIDFSGIKNYFNNFNARYQPQNPRGAKSQR